MALFSLCLCGCGNAKSSAENIDKNGDVSEIPQHYTAERKNFSDGGFDIEKHFG